METALFITPDKTDVLVADVGVFFYYNNFASGKAVNKMLNFCDYEGENSNLSLFIDKKGTISLLHIKIYISAH